jgi:penicillin-binding protein 1C
LFSGLVWVESFVLTTGRTGKVGRTLEWTEWSDVSASFKTLLVKVEDRRFYSHVGVDVFALARAGFGKLTGRSNRGASTISMQVAGLLKSGSLQERRDVFQKVDQIISAVKLDADWTKDQIIEAYVNLVSFRGELVGLKAASRGYFDKNPSGLNETESAILVALLRSPNAAPDAVAKRACAALEVTDCSAVASLTRRVLEEPYRLSRSRALVPVLSKQFIEAGQNEREIHTSLDVSIQDFAINALREQLRALHQQNVHDGAALVLETKTGRVAAYVANGGRGNSSAVQVDGVQMRRQAGSTLKPFVYATTFEQRLLEPSALLDDSPADITVAKGKVYHPRNYDNIFRGFVSVSEALGSSMNVPAVRAIQLVGEGPVLDTMRELGFKNLKHGEYYGPSLALGSVDVSLWELTEAYRQMGVEGPVFSAGTRESIFNILASSEYRRFTFGMDSILSLPFAAAVKTGTSKDMRDNWCIGWTPKYTVGVWVGNFNGDPMWNVSGVSGAAPIWRSLMTELHKLDHKSQKLKYHEPNDPLPKRTISRIRYPANEMLVAVDPDIPTALQQLPIEIENPQGDQEVLLDDASLGPSRDITLWPLKTGKHFISLKDKNGHEIDTVFIEVR